jgi:integrase
MRKKLSAKLLDHLPAAKTKRYEVRDQLMPGLLVRVSVSGGRIWYLTTAVKEQPRRIKLGTYPVLSVSDARDQARKILRQIQLGTYGLEPEKKVTLGEIIPQFITLYSKLRNRSWRDSERWLWKFTELHPRPLEDIKRTHVVRELDHFMARGMGTGTNRALASIKKLFAWCVDRGTIDTNPVTGLKAPAKETSRDRVLSDDEMVTCWRAAEEEGLAFASFTKLLILTGQRRGEVADMRWSELNLATGSWTIPATRAKNATKHVVPLSPVAFSIIASLPRYENSEYVFTTTGSTPISSFGRLKNRLDQALGVEDWRMHDIRRSVATNMAMLGIQPLIIEAVLNHKSGIVSGVAAIHMRAFRQGESHRRLTVERALVQLMLVKAIPVWIADRHGDTREANDGVKHTF